MLNPLTRPQQDYVWAMEQWLRTPGLTPTETSLVTNLLNAAQKSITDFDAMRTVASGGFFRATLISAVEKARACGILKEWPH